MALPIQHPHCIHISSGYQKPLCALLSTQHPVVHLSLCLLEPVNTDEQGWIRWGECWTPETPLLINSEPGASLFLLSSAQEKGRGGGISQESLTISTVSLI